MRRSSGAQAMPRCATWWEAIPPISRPSKVTCPSDGRTSPITVLSVVLLPTPLRPSSPTTSPARTSIDTPWRMWDLP